MRHTKSAFATRKGMEMMDERCTLVEIEQRIPGFNRFIGSWVYQGDMTFLVDVGPRNTAHILTAALENMGIGHIDYIFLTHIHLDHGGALNPVLEGFPMARAVCHDKGVEHLIEPTRLWEGSRKVLQDKGEAFGRPERVEPERIIGHSDVKIGDLIVLETPGHAPHHMSYSYRGTLFSGEAAGNYYSVDGFDYLRPATPPRLFLETFLNSVDKLLALDDQRICYGHFGEARHSRVMLRRFRSQILRWEETISREAYQPSRDLVSHCVDVLLGSDPDLGAFYRMPPDIRDRERYFLANSVRGFLGYLKERREL